MDNKNYGEKRENEKSLKKHLFLFLKNNILLAGAVFAFILLTAAWFVNNSRVQAGSATVSAAVDRKFELAAVGTTGKYDDVLKSILGNVVQDGDSWSFTEDNKNKTGTKNFKRQRRYCLGYEQRSKFKKQYGKWYNRAWQQRQIGILCFAERYIGKT